MVLRASIAEYRDAGAVEKLNPHLHNVPLQIAAERWPAGARHLAVVSWRRSRSISAIVLMPAATRSSPPRRSPRSSSMLAAGLFEYNFGDSEFLMLFLIIVDAAVRGGPAMQSEV